MATSCTEQSLLIYVVLKNYRLVEDELLIAKVCYMCKSEKDLSKFTDLRNGAETEMCLDCRVQRRTHGKKRETRIHEEFIDHLKEECPLCGDDDPSHIHFDHIDPSQKYKNVTNIYSEEKLLLELEKVRAICAKCHVRHTRSQRDLEREERDVNIDTTNKRLMSKRRRKDRNRLYVDGVKIAIGGCQMAGCTDVFDPTLLSFYEFDHLHHGVKSYMISNMACSTFSTKRIQEEIDKCRLLCQYCHRKRTILQWVDKAVEFKNASLPTTKVKRVVAKVNVEIVSKIREDYSSGKFSYKSLVKKYGIQLATIYNIVKNLSWVDSSYIPPDFKSHRAKLTPEIREEIYFRYTTENITKAELSRQYGVTQSTIATVLDRFDND